MSWFQLLDIIKQAKDPQQRGDDIEAGVCPNDGEPLSVGPRGELFCKFDGFRPNGLSNPRP